MKIPLQFLNYFSKSGNLFYLQFIGEELIENATLRVLIEFLKHFIFKYNILFGLVSIKNLIP